MKKKHHNEVKYAITHKKRHEILVGGEKTGNWNANCWVKHADGTRNCFCVQPAIFLHYSIIVVTVQVCVSKFGAIYVGTKTSLLKLDILIKNHPIDTDEGNNSQYFYL